MISKRFYTTVNSKYDPFSNIEIKVITFLGNLILCLLPMLLIPVLGYLISDGYLDFGCGEKDLLLLIPWIFWSFIYLAIFIVVWIKRKKLKVILVYAAGVSTGILALAWVVLFAWSNDLLGIYKG